MNAHKLLNRLSVLALAGLILAVIAIGNAYAYTEYDYQDYIKSKVNVDLVGSWVQGGGNENVYVTRGVPDSWVSCPNIWRNEMNSTVGSASLVWMYSSPAGNPTFDGGEPTSVQLLPGSESSTYYMEAQINTGLSAGTYNYDQHQSYYVYTYPYNLKVYGPSQSTRKTVTLT